MHTLVKMRGGKLSMQALRVGQATLKALSCAFVPVGALIEDEFPQILGQLEHAVALRATYARSATYKLCSSEYAATTQTFGAMPFVVKCGGELQLPPVPEDSSLLAPPTASKVYGAGVMIFAQQDLLSPEHDDALPW